MWANDAEMVDRLADKLARLLRQPEARTSSASAPEPPPFRPEKAPKYETDQERMLRKARDDVRAGRAVSANMMRPKKPKPPRAPDQQREQSNGLWGWWR